MKAFYIFILCLICFTTYAQSSIDIFGGAGYTNQIPTSFQKGTTSYILGTSYNQKIAERIFIKIGMQLFNTGSKYVDEMIKFSDALQLSPIPIFDHNATRKFINKHIFLLPSINSRFELSDRKITPFIEVGVSPSFYLSTFYFIQKNNGDKQTDLEKASNFKFLHWVANTSFGINWNLKNNNQIFIQPTARYFLNNAFKESSSDAHSYIFSVETGIRLSLK